MLDQKCPNMVISCDNHSLIQVRRKEPFPPANYSLSWIEFLTTIYSGLTQASIRGIAQMHSLPFRQKFRQLTVMAAPAANEAQRQGPPVPRVPRANVVQHILAERPPQKPILDSNGLEVM